MLIIEAVPGKAITHAGTPGNTEISANSEANR
jgi:hypothetical protein